MRPFSAFRQRSLVLLVAAATGLVMPATAAATPAPGGGGSPGVLTGQSAALQAPAVRKARKVKVKVKVKNCPGCMITLVAAPRPPAGDEAMVVWTSRDTRVRRGKVVFRVPRERAEGMYLTVRDPDGVSTGAMSIAVARYKGKRVGTKVSHRKAARTKLGFHCVAAPERDRVVWKMQVDRFGGRDVITGERGYQIRPYLSPTQESFGDSMRLYHGVAGAQDIAFCQHNP